MNKHNVPPFRGLSQKHSESLAVSTITPEVASERGYRTITDANDPALQRSAPVQRLVPSLACPLKCQGLPDVLQVRPDTPRADKDKPGKTIKYETPFGANLHLDSPPACWPGLQDGFIPLLITEGVKKADAAFLAGFCAVALPGVWNGVRKNGEGGSSSGGHVLVPEWQDVALDGRLVYLCFDSDVAHKPPVRDALRVLVNLLLREGALIKIVYLPDEPDGSKNGLDDYIAVQGVESFRQLCHFSHFCQPDLTPWETPVPLGEFTVPPFPIDALPPALQVFVDAFCEELQVPADILGPLTLAAIATTVQGAVIVHTGEWPEPLSLYIAVVYPSGGRKTAVLQAVVAPLERYERELNKELEPEIAEAQTKLRILQARLSAKEKAAANGDVPAEAEVPALAREVAAFVVPSPFRLLAEDATPEVIPNLLAQNDGRLAVLSAEGDLFDIIAGRHSDKGPSLGVFLKGHIGESLRVDRIGRVGAYVARPALTIGLAVQPDVLRGLLRVPGLKGRGLLARFLFTVPVSNIGYRKLITHRVPECVTKGYAEVLMCLLTIKPEEVSDGKVCPRLLEFGEAGNTVFLRFRERVEISLRPGELLSGSAEWGSKLPGTVARIAGLLHLAEKASENNTGELFEPISAATIVNAIRLGDYFTEHARAAFAEMGADETLDKARTLRDWIRRHGKAQFTHRDAHRAHQTVFKKAEDLDAALQFLIERGWIIKAEPSPTESGRRGRPAGSAFLVNPLALDKNDKSDIKASRTPEWESIEL